jgi:hypothetical protein
MPEDFDWAAHVAESRARQGLPPTIQDDETLETIAHMVTDSRRAHVIESGLPGLSKPVQCVPALGQTASRDREP